MKKYADYKRTNDDEDLTNEELSSIDWIKFKIIVPTEKDKQNLIEAFEHIHDSDVDTEYVVVNQLSHEYIQGNNIIVDKDLFDTL